MPMLMRSGSILGVKHTRFQDALLTQEFAVGKRTYRIALVADGCTGMPAFSRNEVGANLLPAFCLMRIQEYVAYGMPVEEIPAALYVAAAEFVRALTNLIVAEGAYWPYKARRFPEGEEWRKEATPAARFKADYMSATLLGFIDDGTTLVRFTAGDGITLVNDELGVIDQNNRPNYVSGAVNRPLEGFDIKSYPSAEVQRVLLSTDGLKKLLALPSLQLPGALFANPDDPTWAQRWLNIQRRERAELLDDDCAIVTMHRLPEEVEHGDGTS